MTVGSFPRGEMFSRLARPGERWDIGSNNYFHDFVDPSQFIAPLFATPRAQGNFGRFRDTGIQRRIGAAARLKR